MGKMKGDSECGSKSVSVSESVGACAGRDREREGYDGRG